MSGDLAEIEKMQREWFEAHRHATRYLVVQELDGWSVHVWTIDGVAPPTTYPTKEQAAARLLQMMDIGQPITPQNWPERVGIGFIETEQP